MGGFSLRRKTIYAIRRIAEAEGLSQSRLVDNILSAYIKIYDKVNDNLSE